MHGFEYFVPTEIVFGAGSTEKLPELLKKRGLSHVLVVYGGASAKKSGLLDRVFRLLFGFCRLQYGLTDFHNWDIACCTVLAQ